MKKKKKIEWLPSHFQQVFTMPIVPNTSKSEGTPPKKSTITFDLSRPVYSLSDLILPTHTLNELNRAISLREHQTAVFEQWGFKHTHKYDNKMIINLYGEPGTGKTMAAHAIAKRLNRPLVLINYGDIESKYVGETPKNIQNAFAFAKENDAILFFDEADAILSRRVTNMTSATDTSVNQTRSVMLTLLNDYNDTVLFATNFISNYDPAFMRRILMHIEFGMPDENTRFRLFEKYIPQQLPHSIDLAEAAKNSVSLNGSDIANSVLLAAFSAKNEGLNKVTHQNLMEKVENIRKSKEANAGKKFDVSAGNIIKAETREVTENFVQQQLNKEKLS